MSSGWQYLLLFQSRHSTLKMPCNKHTITRCMRIWYCSLNQQQKLLLNKVQGAQPSQCQVILTSLGLTPTVYSGEGSVVTHSSQGGSFRLFGEMLGENNLVLTCALLLLYNMYNIIIKLHHLLFYHPSSIYVFSFFKSCFSKMIKRYFFF